MKQETVAVVDVACDKEQIAEFVVAALAAVIAAVAAAVDDVDDLYCIEQEQSAHAVAKTSNKEPKQVRNLKDRTTTFDTLPL